jgi:hypothetical protein
MIPAVIPSYNRLDIIKTKALSFLNKHQYSPIYIFVDPRCLEEYKQLRSDRVRVVKGRMGLDNQRNAIRDYFPEDEKLFILDDDFEDIRDFKDDLNKLVKKSFADMVKNECTLGGINPTNNLYFLSHKIKYGLYLCVGCFYFEINKKNKEFYYYPCQEKEDYYRTLIHYFYRGKVYRNDNYCVKHKYLKNEGGMQCQDRLWNNNKMCKYLRDEFKYNITLFNKLTKLEVKFKSYKFLKLKIKIKYDITPAEYYDIHDCKIIDKDYMVINDEPIAYFIKGYIQPPNNLIYLEKFSNKVSTQRGAIAGKIEKNKLPKYALKYYDPKNISKSGYIIKSHTTEICNGYKSQNFGYYLDKGKLKMNTDTKRFYKDFEENKFFIEQMGCMAKKYFPEYEDTKYVFDTIFNTLTINNNGRSACHIDGKNKSWGCLTAFGNYKGGEVIFPEFKIAFKLEVGDILIFNSRIVYHANAPFTGNRISVVGYQSINHTSLKGV